MGVNSDFKVDVEGSEDMMGWEDGIVGLAMSEG